MEKDKITNRISEELVEEDREFDSSGYGPPFYAATEEEKQQQLKRMKEICKGLPDIEGPAYTEEEYLRRLSD
jgi:23S rRNA A1618 N6-methylase RlmF